MSSMSASSIGGSATSVIVADTLANLKMMRQLKTGTLAWLLEAYNLVLFVPVGTAPLGACHGLHVLLDEASRTGLQSELPLPSKA